MNSSWIQFRIEPPKLALLKFILEGYDHLAILTILEPKEAKAQIYFYYTEKDLIKEILQDFSVQILQEFLD